MRIAQRPFVSTNNAHAMGRPARDRWFSTRGPIWLAATIGLLLQLNIIPAAFGSRFLHITDPIMLVGAPLLATIFTRGWMRIAGLACFIPLLCWLMLVLAYSWSQGDLDIYQRILIYCYALCGSFFVLHTTRRPLLEPFCMGTIVGAVFSILLLILDSMAALPLAKFGLALEFDREAVLDHMARGEAVGNALRIAKAGGLWAAGNEAGPALALAAPAVAYLCERRKALWPYILFLTIYLAGFAFTQNRSGLFAVLIVGAILFLRLRSFRKLVAAIFVIPIVAALLLGLSATAGLAGFDQVVATRFTEDSHAEENVSERMRSTVVGLQLAITYPLGISYESRVAKMRMDSGVATPHNGFIILSFNSGILFSLFLIFSTAYAIIFSRNHEIYFKYVAVSFSFCMFFEELHINPIFMFYFGIIMGFPMLSIMKKRGKRPVEA